MNTNLMKISTKMCLRLGFLFLFEAVALPSFLASDSAEVSSFEYAIRAAKMAKQAYEYAQFGYFLKDDKIISTNINSAIVFVSASIDCRKDYFILQRP